MKMENNYGNIWLVLWYKIKYVRLSNIDYETNSEANQY